MENIKTELIKEPNPYDWSVRMQTEFLATLRARERCKKKVAAIEERENLISPIIQAVEAARIKHGMSKRRFAKELGVKYMTYYMWTYNKIIPRAETIHMLKKKLKALSQGGR